MNRMNKLFAAFTLFFLITPAQALELPGPLVVSGLLAYNFGQVVFLVLLIDVDIFTCNARMLKVKKTGQL